MRYLLDTKVLLWAASSPEKLTPELRASLENPQNDLCFSAASMWEIAMKNTLGRPDLKIDLWHLRRCLQNNEYSEIPVTSEHVAFTQMLEKLHHDPFDRMLIAQACVDDLRLLTADHAVNQYSGPIQMVTEYASS